MDHRKILKIILLSIFARLNPHPPNMAPIGALALYSGTNFEKAIGVLIPLSVMLLSDIFLGFHSTMIFVYGSFALIFFLGRFLKNKTSVKNVIISSLTISFLFFIITNFGVWLTTSMYEKNMQGLMICYAMGLPFLKNTILGDLMYNAVFFFAPMQTKKFLISLQKTI